MWLCAAAGARSKKKKKNEKQRELGDDFPFFLLLVCAVKYSKFHLFHSHPHTLPIERWNLCTHNIATAAACLSRSVCVWGGVQVVNGIDMFHVLRRNEIPSLPPVTAAVASASTRNAVVAAAEKSSLSFTKNLCYPCDCSWDCCKYFVHQRGGGNGGSGLSTSAEAKTVRFAYTTILHSQSLHGIRCSEL